ncbi:MAG: class I tRNA ligase family protein [Clostridia bacterium]|nr:class I tRNA ligase family protein [Clostridia bacterium]
MNCEGADIKPITDVKPDVKDKWILSRFNKTVKAVTIAMEKYDLGMALTYCHDFMWYDFCDWYIELTKPALYGQDEVKKSATLSVLCHVLAGTLKLLHPFIPFVTEEIYSFVPTVTGSIMVSEYPKYNPKYNYKKDAEKMDAVMDIIKAVRQIKVQAGAVATKKVELFVVTENKKLISDSADFIYKLAGVSKIDFIDGKQQLDQKVFTQVLNGFELYIPLGDLVDIEKEVERLKAELIKVDGEIERAKAKLNNAGFLAKAPKNLVEAEKQKVSKFEELKEKIISNLSEYED